jgi:hypothetical protein
MALEATSKTKPPIAQSHCQHWDLLIGVHASELQHPADVMRQLLLAGMD